MTASAATDVTSDYSAVVSHANKAISEAESRLNKLYDLDRELLSGYISETERELARLAELKNKIQAAASNQEKDSLLTEFNNTKILLAELCDKIVIHSAESRVVSARSAWHRPCEKTYDEIKANVESFKKIGINLLFVETFYHGCSAFKSSVTAFPYHPSLASTYTDTEKNVTYNDYLSAFVACCKEYGIEVHAWVENFYVGINAGASVLQKHPDWIMYNDDGSTAQRKEGGAYIFIDPANREVQDTLIDYYNDLFKKHPDVTGLNLDYIRYPVSTQSEDTGYTEAAMKGFYASLGKTFSEAQLADRAKMTNKFKQLFNKNYLVGGQTEADGNYQMWAQYRTEIITDFVRRIKNEVKIPNDIILSTAVFATVSESLNSKKQDWQSWFKSGWIDIATPMAYYTSYGIVQSNVETMIALGGNACLYYTGIASSYSGLPAWQNKEFIEASYRAGASGYVIFSSAQILGHSDVQLALGGGVNSKDAVLPHAAVSEILLASFDDIIDKADRLYISAGGMTEGNKASLKAIFDEIKEMPGDDAYSIYLICRRIDSLIDNEIKNYAKGYSRDRITEQLGELSDILDARVSIELIREGRWNPELNAERPELLGCVPEPTDSESPSNPEEPSDSENPDTPDNQSGANGSGKEESENPILAFFNMIIEAIIRFFESLFLQ